MILREGGAISLHNPKVSSYIRRVSQEGGFFSANIVLPSSNNPLHCLPFLCLISVWNLRTYKNNIVKNNLTLTIVYPILSVKIDPTLNSQLCIQDVRSELVIEFLGDSHPYII